MFSHLASSEVILLFAYYFTLSLLSCLGLHRIWLLVLGKSKPASPAKREGVYPDVLIQLPVYNEPEVIERLIESSLKIRYPRENLEIQILDDSTDNQTSKLVEKFLKKLSKKKEQLPRISHLKRADRVGFKAGALEEGMKKSAAQLIVIFDADFIPSPEFLNAILPSLLDDTRVGFVQSRWGFLNESSSFLTTGQATLLNGHFCCEHHGRSCADLIFNFNGTAGVWKREAIESAGGWKHDTLTEDFDLSFRAYMQGWKGVFRYDLVSPSELPEDYSALLSQQQRWSRGSIQTLKKTWLRLWGSSLSLDQKIDGTITLVQGLAWPLIIFLILMTPPVFYIRQHEGLWDLLYIDLIYLIPATICFFLYYFVAGRRAGRSVIKSSSDSLAAMVLGLALSWNNTLAVVKGLFPGTGIFVRTPKTGNTQTIKKVSKNQRFRFPLEGIVFPSLTAVYLLWAIKGTVDYHVYLALPFLALFLVGMILSVYWSLKSIAFHNQ